MSRRYSANKKHLQSLPALPPNLAQFSSIQLGMNLSNMLLNTSAGRNTHTHAGAQALEASAVSTSNMTATQTSSNGVANSPSVFDSNAENSAVVTRGANLTASEKTLPMKRGARNNMMRNASGDNDGLEDKNGKVRSIHRLRSLTLLSRWFPDLYCSWHLCRSWIRQVSSCTSRPLHGQCCERRVIGWVELS